MKIHRLSEHQSPVAMVPWRLSLYLSLNPEISISATANKHFDNYNTDSSYLYIKSLHID